MNRVDKEIDVNLRILFDSPDHEMWTDKLIKPNDPEDYLNNIERKGMADKLEREGLLIRTNEILNITRFGIEVSEFGGWLKYIEAQREEVRRKNDYETLKTDLETRNLELSNENLEYQRSNRELSKQINLLQKENLKLQNMKIYLSVGFFVAGILIDQLIKFLG